VRLVAGILVGGIATGSLLPNMFLAERLPATAAPVVWIALLVAIPLAVGALVQRCGSIAAAGAFVVGIGLWIALWLRPSPPWSPSDNWSLMTWTMLIVGQVAPGLVITAVLGAIGGAAARWVRSSRARAHGRVAAP
jgi:hypothetical protein